MAANLVMCFVMAGCTPTLNWRTVRLDTLSAWLPCKPDEVTRPFLLGDAEVSIVMQGCEAAGAMFAISHARFPPALTSSQVIEAWQKSTLRKLQSSEVASVNFIAPMLSAVSPTALKAIGHGSNGNRLEAQLVWFVNGSSVYHLAVYAEVVTAEMTEPFFTELRLQ